MAYILNIRYCRFSIAGDGNEHSMMKTGEVLSNFPVLVQKNGSIWIAGCAYLASKAEEVWIGKLSMKTIRSYAWQLLSYLNYCETAGLDPMFFGIQRLAKPTYLYRGYLIRQRDGFESKKLSSTTVSARMNAIVRFFDWAINNGWLDSDAQPFRIKTPAASSIHRFMVSQKISLKFTDISIRKSRTDRSTLEGGLLPVSMEVRDKILAYAHKFSSPEFCLILEVGFRTGLRIQTICGLNVDTFSTAVKGDSPNMYYFNVGPKFNVPTKFGVNYRPQIPQDLLEKVQNYIHSPRRKLRIAKAEKENKEIVFLNRWGKTYNQSGSDMSSSISQDLHRLRTKIGDELDLREFYFHCTRATFGTSIVIAGLKASIPINKILNRVKELLGHKHTTTTLKYISFIEELKTNDAIDQELKR